MKLRIIKYILGDELYVYFYLNWLGWYKSNVVVLKYYGGDYSKYFFFNTEPFRFFFPLDCSKTPLLDSSIYKYIILYLYKIFFYKQILLYK